MENQNLNTGKTIRNLVLFTIVVLSIGFIGRGLDVQMGNPPSESLGMLLWLVVPSVFSLLLRAAGKTKRQAKQELSKSLGHNRTDVIKSYIPTDD